MSKKQYNFRDDPFIQELGKKLFPGSCSICLNKTFQNKKLISYCVQESLCNRYKNYLTTPAETRVRIYPEYNTINDNFDIAIIIEKTTRQFVRNVEIIIPGKEKDQQNLFIDYLSGPVYHELWSKDLSYRFSSLDIPYVEIYNEDTLFDIKGFNEMGMKECSICGRKISVLNETDICLSCRSKIISTTTHGIHI